MNRKLRYSLLVAAVLAAVFLLSLNTIGDFDIGYHLENGAFIVTHGFVPTHDIFSYTAPGALWINHYWFSDVAFYFAYRAGTSWGLITIVALVSLLTYGIVLFTAFQKSRNVPLVAVVLIPYSLLTYELWVARPQIFSYLFTALIIFIFERWRDSKDFRLLLAIPLVLLIWANMHASVILGIGIAGLYLLYGFIFFALRRADRMRLALIGALSFAVTLVNPNGWRLLAYSSIIGPTVQQLGVAEWRSLLDYLITWQAWSFLALMLLVFFFCAYTLFWENDRWIPYRVINWPALFLLLVAVVLPIVSIRHVGFFPLITFPIFIYCVEKKFPRVALLESMIPSLTVLLFIFLVVAYGIARARTIPAVNTNLLPVNATQFIQKQNMQGPIFDDASFGGYLIWKLWPHTPVFIDGRDDVYMGTPADDYVSIMTTAPGWEALVNQKYRINYFILWYEPPLTDLVSNLTARLTGDLGFKLVYWDDTAIILARDDPQNKSLVDAFAYHYISPFVRAGDIPVQDRAAAADEWMRAMTIAPGSAVLQNYLR